MPYIPRSSGGGGGAPSGAAGGGLSGTYPNPIVNPQGLSFSYSGTTDHSGRLSAGGDYPGATSSVLLNVGSILDGGITGTIIFAPGMFLYLIDSAGGISFIRISSVVNLGSNQIAVNSSGNFSGSGAGTPWGGVYNILVMGMPLLSNAGITGASGGFTFENGICTAMPA